MILLLFEYIQLLLLFMLSFKNKIKIQYVSDVHVDNKNYMPNIEQHADILAICGDIGKVTHPTVDKFIGINAKKFEKVFIVAGNHEYDCCAVYNEEKVNKYKPILKNICESYNNVILLDKSCYKITDEIIIAGATLWSSSEYIVNKTHMIKHNEIHNDNMNWIKNICEDNSTSKIVMMTHYVPTFKLIEHKYLHHGKLTTLFATDLEHLINKPIVAWLCGHTHSINNVTINGIFCGINALGHNIEKDCLVKTIDIIRE